MGFVRNIIHRHRHILIYAFCSAVLVFLLKWMQWKFLIADNSIDVDVGLIAVFFTVLGVWIASQLAKPKIKTVIVEKEVFIEAPVSFERNEAELAKLNLSSREFEVLEIMSEGKSNAEIAAALFLSVSTIKTHASNLFFKLDVKSRTQAIEKAKRIRILP